MEIQKICFSGFGGQGVLSMGKLLAYAAMIEDKEVSWCPSYGPEMRGGTANCTVSISNEPIGSPVAANDATAAVVMNLPSFDKFVHLVKAGGTVVINSSLVNKKVTRTDIKVIYIPANEIAKELGNPKLLNMIMLGTLVESEHPVKKETILEAFTHVFGENKNHLIPINQKALDIGAQYAKPNQG